MTPSARGLAASLCTLLWMISAGAASAQQTRIEDYEKSRKIFWNKLYRGGGESLYCGVEFNGWQKNLNIEHVFPMSWATRTLNCGTRKQCRKRSDTFNYLEADLHNLYPSRKDVNDDRGSYPFAMIDGEVHSYSGCDVEIDHNRRVVEPRPATRGEIARAMFYMHSAYGMEIRKKQGIMLKRWHFDDPPSDLDRDRNDLIESIQGTRNRYIDDPKLVKELWF